MEPIWLKSYPPGVPAEIDMTQLSYDTQIGLDFILVDSSDGASPLAPQAGAVL